MPAVPQCSVAFQFYVTLWVHHCQTHNFAECKQPDLNILGVKLPKNYCLQKSPGGGRVSLSMWWTRYICTYIHLCINIFSHGRSLWFNMPPQRVRHMMWTWTLMLPLVPSVTVRRVWTLCGECGVYGDRQDSGRHNTRRSSFFSQGRPGGECAANKSV